MAKARALRPNIWCEKVTTKSPTLCLSNVSTAKFLFSALGNMRKKKELCDVKISVKSQCISAHQAILAATMPYFREMFVNGVKEIPEEGLTINEVDADALESLIDYAYGEELKITEENVRTLFATAHVLQLREVKLGCAKFMETKLNLKNVVEVRNFAERMSARSLITSCDKYLLENIRDFFVSDTLLSLSFPVLRDIMEGMAFYRIFNSKTINEEKLFEGIISWIKDAQANHEERERMLSELFRNIQLERISLDYLCESIASEQLIQTSQTCMQLVEKAKAAHVPSTTASVYCRLFYQSSRNTLRQSHFRARRSGSGVYAVCCSKNFGLYVRIYDSLKEKWVTLTQGITATSCFKHIVCRKGRIEIFGDQTHLAFETGQLEWSTRENPLLVFHKVLEHGNKIYIFDDEPCSSNESFVWQDGVRIFSKKPVSVDADRTSMKIVMPSIAYWKEYIYISGGQLDGKCVNFFERYSPGTNTWTDLAPMLTRRYGHISAVLDYRIFVCGGINDMQENLNTVEVFSIEGNRWSSLAPMKMARSRFSLVSWKGKLYAAGGAENSGPMYSFEIYDPNIYQWQCAAPIYVWDEVGKTKLKIISVSEDDYVEEPHSYDYDFFDYE